MGPLRYWLLPNGGVMALRLVDHEEPFEGGTEVRLAPLDAIVIERSSLPGVEFMSDGTAWAAGQTTQSAEKAHEAALAFHSLAEHLRARPPVDESEVARLADLLTDEDDSDFRRDRLHSLARRLVERGVRAPGGAS